MVDTNNNVSRILACRPTRHRHPAGRASKGCWCRTGDPARRWAGPNTPDNRGQGPHVPAEPSAATAGRAAPAQGGIVRRGWSPTIRGLTAHNLGKSFKKRPVLRAVSVSVQRGEAVGLLGPNGAGKTTCFYIITGLIRPDAGIHHAGRRGHHRAADVSPRAARHRLSAAGGVDLPRPHRRAEHPRRARGCPSPSRRRATACSTRCWPSSRSPICAARRRWRCRAASGGASRSPARWPRSPHFILLDEPLAGIDPIAVGDIRDLVAHLKDRGIGVLITDHNVRETLEIIDRAYILHEGQVLMEGAPDGDRARRRCAPRLSGRKIQLVSFSHGAHPKIRSQAIPGAGHDAAVAAGDQAAATVERRVGRLCRRRDSSRTRCWSATRARPSPASRRNRRVRPSPAKSGRTRRRSRPRPRRPRKNRTSPCARKAARRSRPRRWRCGARAREPRARATMITPATPIPGRRAAPPRAPDREPARARIGPASTRRWRAIRPCASICSTQLAVDLHDPADRLIGAHLIDMIDEAGYLNGGFEPIAELLGCDVARIEKTLPLLQGFDPPGIFARNLAECLALQLKERDRFDPAMQALIENLPLLANRDQAALMRICGVDAEDLSQMVAEIKSLDPKPGLAFDRVRAEPVVPDVFLRPLPDGSWSVELNTDTLPRVLVNNRYYAEVIGRGQEQDREGIPLRALSGGQLAGQGAAPARHHHPEGGARDRAPAGRVPAPRRAAFEAAGAARHRHRHQHAREHGEPRHHQQIHADAARRLRVEIFLHFVHIRLLAARRIRPRRCASASAR